MSTRPFREGDFVWCAFPEREDPVRPGPLHVAYTLAVSVGDDGFGATALVAYTTSQPWPGQTLPPGVIAFDRAAAASIGQTRAFVLDLRRLAAIPITLEWFPRLARDGHGVAGRIPRVHQRQFLQIVEGLLTRHPEIIERLGPLWPGERH